MQSLPKNLPTTHSLSPRSHGLRGNAYETYFFGEDSMNHLTSNMHSHAEHGNERKQPLSKNLPTTHYPLPTLSGGYA